MKPEQITEALEAAAGELGVRVRYDPLSAGGLGASGGLCKVKGEWWVILDKKSSPAERAAALADALANFDTDRVSLPPKVREVVDLRRAALGGSGMDKQEGTK